MSAPIPNLSEALIRQNATVRVFERGKRAYQTQAVRSLIKRGNSIQAEVGNSILYQVQIELDQNGILSATSNYKGNYKGDSFNQENSWCRYTVAALFACLHQPELITEKVTVESLLAQLNRDQFQTLVQNMIKFDPSLLEEIEMAAQFLLEHSGITESSVKKTLELNSTINPIEDLEVNAPLITEELITTEELIEAIATTATQPDATLIPQQIENEKIQPKLESTDLANQINLEAVVEASEQDALEQRLIEILPEVSSHWEDKVIEFVGRISALIPQGENLRLIKLLLPLINAYINSLDRWDTEDENSELHQRIEQFQILLTEAWLSLVLDAESAQLQEEIMGEIEIWDAKLLNLDLSESFDMSYIAIKQGWNYPPLQQVLAGNITPSGAWEGEVPSFGDRLAEIRLRILARTERWQEYLNFAAAEGQVTAYLSKLIDLGELEEAIKLAAELISDPREALIVAQKIEETQQGIGQENKTKKAIEIAQLGLNLEGDSHKYELAEWLGDLAELIQPEVCLEARIIAFKLKPSLKIYQKIAKSLMPDQWRSHKESLLEILLHDPANNFQIAQAKIEIFLTENLLAEAIQVAENLQASYHDPLVKLVMDRVMDKYAEWVSENATARAETIMTTAKAKYYEEAIAWLKYAKKAQSPQVWQAYHQQLIQTYSRKRKLVELLQKI